MTSGQKASRRDRLLDSAEYLFATDSYHAVSLKQISKHSEVNLGLINYYFGTKEKLLQDVLARRSHDFIGQIKRNHDQFQNASENGLQSFNKLLRAHFRPFVDYAVSEDQGKRNYIRIVVDVDLWQSQALGGAAAELWNVSMRLFDLAQKCFPGTREENLRVALYMAGTTMSYMFRDNWALSEITGGRFRQDNLDEMFGLVIDFFSGGTEKLVGATRSSTSG